MTEAIGARRLSTLLAFPGFARLGTLDVAALSALADEVVVPRGAALLPGGPVKHACFVLDGTVRVTARGQTHLAGPRDAVGILELLADDPDGVEAVAETETRALAISRKAFLDFLEDSTAAAFDTLRIFARRVVDVARTGPMFHWLGAPRLRVSPAKGPLSYADKLLCVHAALRNAPRRLAATAEVARVSTERRIRAGEVLWHAGDPADSGAILVSGEIECTPRGSSRAFRATAGDPIGGLEAMARVPRWYHAVAVSDVVLLHIEHGDLLDILEDHVDLTIDLLRSMAAILLRFERLA